MNLSNLRAWLESYANRCNSLGRQQTEINIPSNGLSKHAEELRESFVLTPAPQFHAHHKCTPPIFQVPCTHQEHPLVGY